MVKENRNAKMAFFGCIGSMALAVLLIVVYLFTGSNSSLELINTFIAMASFFLIILSALLYLVVFVLLGWEIATAKNDSGWKALWIAILLFSLLFSGAPGIILYWLVGRKALKD